MSTKKNTVVKDDIVRAVYEGHGGISQKDASNIVELLFDIMKDHVFNDKKVLLSGFGKFELVRRKSRRIADPNSRQHMVLPDRWAVKFKPSQSFVDGVNKE